MTNSARAAFVSALNLNGEAELRRHLIAGRYRGKKWKQPRPIMHEWLAKQAWRRVAWLN